MLLGVVPFILMRGHLEQSWALIYAAQICLAVVAAGAVGYSLGENPELSFRNGFQALATFAGVALVFHCPPLHGKFSSSILHSLLIGPSKLGSLFLRPLRVPGCIGPVWLPWPAQ